MELPGYLAPSFPERRELAELPVAPMKAVPEATAKLARSAPVVRAARPLDGCATTSGAPLPVPTEATGIAEAPAPAVAAVAALPLTTAVTTCPTVAAAVAAAAVAVAAVPVAKPAPAVGIP